MKNPFNNNNADDNDDYSKDSSDAGSNHDGMNNEHRDETTSNNSSHALSSSHKDESRALKEVQAIAAVETKRMKFWKLVIILGILSTGAGVCSVVFIFLRNKQESDFESEVRGSVLHTRN